MLKLISVLTVIAVLTNQHVAGHGRLMDPPSRGSMWRFGFDNIPNYTDNGLNCGGKDVQFNENGGKCGVCGDNYSDQRPRENELNGLYGKAGIVGTYNVGQVLPIWVELTASHKGYFQFGLCNIDTQPEEEDCFQPLSFADGSSRFDIATFDAENYTSILVQLPETTACERCVLRWHYTAGNSVGECPDGTYSVDCADQETFRNCADIKIGS